MVKQIKVVECDLCGRIDEMPITLGLRNEEVHKLPDMWKKVRKLDLCPRCVSVIKKDYETSIQTGLLE